MTYTNMHLNNKTVTDFFEGELSCNIHHGSKCLHKKWVKVNCFGDNAQDTKCIVIRSDEI